MERKPWFDDAGSIEEIGGGGKEENGEWMRQVLDAARRLTGELRVGTQQSDYPPTEVGDLDEEEQEEEEDSESVTHVENPGETRPLEQESKLDKKEEPGRDTQEQAGKCTQDSQRESQLFQDIECPSQKQDQEETYTITQDSQRESQRVQDIESPSQKRGNLPTTKHSAETPKTISQESQEEEESQKDLDTPFHQPKKKTEKKTDALELLETPFQSIKTKKEIQVPQSAETTLSQMISQSQQSTNSPIEADVSLLDPMDIPYKESLPPQDSLNDGFGNLDSPTYLGNEERIQESQRSSSSKGWLSQPRTPVQTSRRRKSTRLTTVKSMQSYTSLGPYECFFWPLPVLQNEQHPGSAGKAFSDVFDGSQNKLVRLARLLQLSNESSGPCASVSFELAVHYTHSLTNGSLQTTSGAKPFSEEIPTLLPAAQRALVRGLRKFDHKRIKALTRLLTLPGFTLTDANRILRIHPDCLGDLETHDTIEQMDGIFPLQRLAMHCYLFNRQNKPGISPPAVTLRSSNAPTRPKVTSAIPFGSPTAKSAPVPSSTSSSSEALSPLAPKLVDHESDPLDCSGYSTGLVFEVKKAFVPQLLRTVTTRVLVRSLLTTDHKNEVLRKLSTKLQLAQQPSWFKPFILTDLFPAGAGAIFLLRYVGVRYDSEQNMHRLVDMLVSFPVEGREADAAKLQPILEMYYGEKEAVGEAVKLMHNTMSHEPARDILEVLDNFIAKEQESQGSGLPSGISHTGSSANVTSYSTSSSSCSTTSPPSAKKPKLNQ